MNTHEYIEKLQRKECKKNDVPWDVFQDFITKGGKIEDLCKYLISKLGHDYQYLLELPVCFLPMDEFDAWIEPKYGLIKPFIAICWGLPNIMYELYYSLISMSRSKDFNKLREMVFVCAYAVKHGWLKVISPEISHDLAEKHKGQLNIMVNALLSFILLHEYSHYILKHTGHFTFSSDIEQGLTRKDKRDYSKSQIIEFDADTKAVELFNKAFGNNANNYYSIIYLFFELSAMFENLFSFESSTHPPALDRWIMISENWRCKDQHQLEVVKITNKIFDSDRKYGEERNKLSRKKITKYLGF